MRWASVFPGSFAPPLIVAAAGALGCACGARSELLAWDSEGYGYGSGSGSGGNGVGSLQCGAGPSCDDGQRCNGESCCLSLPVPGGSYSRGGDSRYRATVSSFCLDKYEVTVGRMRTFLSAYDSWRSSGSPREGDGEHQPGAGTGWQTDWNRGLASDAEAFRGPDHLTSGSMLDTWTDDVTDHENYPINCVSWYEAFAFCIWDGGRLATEAEWEYAARGGSQSRRYPWGNDDSEPLPANYRGHHNTPFLDVGSEPDGSGYWGHADLAGSMFEWVVDWYADSYPSSCSDCANSVEVQDRVVRGGAYPFDTAPLRSGARGFDFPSHNWTQNGIRCVRAPQDQSRYSSNLDQDILVASG